MPGPAIGPGIRFVRPGTAFAAVALDGCKNITEIPAALFDAIAAEGVTFSSSSMKYTVLETIPVGLFDKGLHATTFSNLFEGCSPDCCAGFGSVMPAMQERMRSDAGPNIVRTVVSGDFNPYLCHGLQGKCVGKRPSFSERRGVCRQSACVAGNPAEYF